MVKEVSKVLAPEVPEGGGRTSSQDVLDVVAPGFWEGPPPMAETSLLAVLFFPFSSLQHRLKVGARVQLSLMGIQHVQQSGARVNANPAGVWGTRPHVLGQETQKYLRRGSWRKMDICTDGGKLMVLGVLRKFDFRGWYI